MTVSRPVVLVVEDEPLILLFATDFIEDAGFEVLPEKNADDAICILENRLDVKIVFTDIDMPGAMDGMKLASAIRGRWPPIELIITSGGKYSEIDLPVRCIFIKKPYYPKDVVAIMNSILSKAHI